MEMINIKINGVPFSVEKGISALEACRRAGINIPTLCYLKEVNEIGACRICLVEVKGARGMVAACVYPVDWEMEIFTNTAKVRRLRKANLELILSNHDRRCLSCVRSTTCELQKLSVEYGVEENKFEGELLETTVDAKGCIVRDNSKCILCRRCTSICTKSQEVGVIGANNRGFYTEIGSFFDQSLEDTACIKCGQCVAVCPTAALTERDQVDEVLAAIADPNKHVAVCMAPSIRTQLGEMFGNPIGTNVEGQMVASAKMLGFDGVYDMCLTADLTIMEEASEFLTRFESKQDLPLMTSCCPGWVKYCEHYYPELVQNLSSCKSPQQMFGAIYKSYYAKKMGLDPKDIVMVSCIPCVGKKFEVAREVNETNGLRDVDVAITTREFGRMIARAGIDFNALASAKYDDAVGTSSGAGTIFGATGGVMEAALRTAAETIIGKPLESVEFNDVRGVAGIKRAKYKLGDKEISVAVVSGTANAKKLIDAVKAGEDKVDFIEVMACAGGCVNGGGQPHQPAVVLNNVDLRAARAQVLYNSDAANSVRRAHDNPAIKALYEEFLGTPGGDKAHELLHTTYTKRGL